MKILLIPALYAPHYGGLETVVRKIAGQMQFAGHTVEIFTNRYPRQLPYREMIDDIPVTRLFFLLPRLGYLRSGRWDLWLGGLFFFPVTIVQLLFLILRFRPDVVNVHYLTGASFFFWIFHHFFRFRLVVSLHGGDVDGEPYRNRFNNWLFRNVLARADYVTTCSQALLDQALALSPSISAKSHVIYNGVNWDMFACSKPFAHPRPYLFGVGKLERHKGFDILIAAFTRLSSSMPDLDLLIAGDGAEREHLQAQIHDAGLESHVHLVGRQTPEQVAALMRGARVLVIPSRRESFGIVGLEAMASGRPIVATRVGGLQEALDRADVAWVESDNVADLVIALHRQLQETQASSVLLTNQKVSRLFSWEMVSQKYLDLYTINNTSV